MRYFAYDYGLTMTNRRFADLFGRPRRNPESAMEQFHWDMAASVQVVTEEIVLAIVRCVAHRRERTVAPRSGISLPSSHERVMTRTRWCCSVRWRTRT